MGLIMLDTLGPDGADRARYLQEIRDVTGTPLALLSLTSSSSVVRAMTILRSSAPLPEQDRLAAIARAGELFSSATLDGLTSAEYEYAVTRTTGIPLSAVREDITAIACRAATMRQRVNDATPRGTAADPRTRSTYRVSSRRGEVLSVHVTDRRPIAQASWLEALALGYRIAVRPSRGEPFTPHRLVTALRAAGFTEHQVMSLPADDDNAEDILMGADLAYGIDGITSLYENDPKIISKRRGPSVVLLPSGTDWRQHLEAIVRTAVRHGTDPSVSGSTVLVESDPDSVAEALAQRCAAIPGLPPEDKDAVLPVLPVRAARALASSVRDRADGVWIAPDSDVMVDELGDGSAALRPAVLRVGLGSEPKAGAESPFPCLQVAPWKRDAGLAHVKNAVIVTAFTRDEGLIKELTDDSAIDDLRIKGGTDHQVGAEAPRADHLAESLMRMRTVTLDG
nr:aldehyde dehydrogenase [Streptomyces canus]